ncbi:MAG: hypothetical protein ABSG67_11640 [Thermoguttaceae bacterium]
MNDLFKTFEKFIFRDLSFLLGGSVVVISGMYIYNRLPTANDQAFKYFIWAGISYAIGYCIQELFTLVHLVIMKPKFPLKWIGRLLYKIYDRDWPKHNNGQDYHDAKWWLYQKDTPQRFQDDYERTESLKQVGTTLGPCFFLSGLILLMKKYIVSIEFKYVVSYGLIALGVFLFLLGWLKVTQQSEHLIEIYIKRKQK